MPRSRESWHLNCAPHRLSQSLALILFVCVWLCTHLSPCMWKPEINITSSPITLHLILRWVSMNIELTDLATLAGQQAPGLFLSAHSSGNTGKRHCA